jgi:hypothetical protein
MAATATAAHVPFSWYEPMWLGPTSGDGDDGVGIAGGGGASSGFPNGGGGGGGGSSFVAPAGTGVTSAADHSGDGEVTITYDPSTDSCPTPPTTPGPEPGPDGGAVAGGPAVAVMAQPNFTG